MTSLAEFAEAVTGDAPNTVIVSGTLSADSELEMLDVGSNKTIVGDGADAKLIGFGLNISGFPATALDSDTCEPEHEGLFEPISNVIIQNLTFEESPDDSINVQCYAHHIWIDHNTFYPAGDGSIDVKRGSDLVTVSWNHFIDTNKTMLLGHDEGNGEQDRGRLRATYHHNWFDNTISRTPLVRFGYAHVFNNYILTSDYFLGVGVEALSALLAERAGAASSEQPASAGSTPPGTTGVALRGTLRLGCD
jgi:pectate lyase